MAKLADNTSGTAHTSHATTHELNNLLAAIRNYAAFVHKELSDAVARGEKRWTEPLNDIEQIRDAAEQATTLICPSNRVRGPSERPGDA